MNKEEIIELAKKADLTQHENPHFGTYTATTVSLMRFAKMIAKHERENFCAQLAQLHDYYSLASHTTTLRGQE